jgi:hypothetical protein
MKKKIRAEKYYYLMLAIVVFPSNRTQKFESTCHSKFGFSMTLGRLTHYFEFTHRTNTTPIFWGDASLDLVVSHPIQPMVE